MSHATGQQVYDTPAQGRGLFPITTPALARIGSPPELGKLFRIPPGPPDSGLCSPLGPPILDNGTAGEVDGVVYRQVRISCFLDHLLHVVAKCAPGLLVYVSRDKVLDPWRRAGEVEAFFVDRTRLAASNTSHRGRRSGSCYLSLHVSLVHRVRDHTGFMF